MRFENGERVDSGSEYDGLTNLKMSIKLPISTIKSRVTSEKDRKISINIYGFGNQEKMLPKFVDCPISSVFAKIIRDAFICRPSILN